MHNAKNTFNKINRIGIFWTIHHLWPSGDLFNYYRHHSSLALINGDGMANVLHGRESVTQGDPLTMVAYGIVILPLIKCLKSTCPDVMQPWYADYAGALGMFNNLERCFNFLTHNGPDRGH